jgi:acetyltransferase
MPRTDLAREVIRGALAQGRDRLTTTHVRKLLAAIGVRDRDTAGLGVKGTELYVGVARDVVFGPVIRFGRGTSSGLAGEPVVALPPLDTAIIDTLMRTSRISGLFTVGGGMAAAEVGAFERTLWALSELVSELPEILELEMHRLVATGGQVYASGARVAIAPPPPGARRYDHMAIHPYPSGIGARWTLRGGAVVRVRPIRPEDAEMEASFVKNLSIATKSFRFMVAMKELPRELLIRLTQIDYDRELALVALVEGGGVEHEIAVARYAMTDADTAEIAIVVADEWQRRGVGLRLLEMIIEAARARGIARLEGEVLDENAAVIALVRRLGFSIRRDPTVGHIRVIEKILTP